MSSLLTRCKLIHGVSRGFWKLPAVLGPMYNPSQNLFRNGAISPNQTSQRSKATEVQENVQVVWASEDLSSRPKRRIPKSPIFWFGSISSITGIIVGLIMVLRAYTYSRLGAQDEESESAEERASESEKAVVSTEKTKVASSKKNTFEMTRSELVQHYRGKLMKWQHDQKVPGISIAVSVDGDLVWAEGFGYADLENSLPCKPNTVMNIGGLTKSITMVAAAKLWEQGLLDMDRPVQDYVPEFPVKFWEKQPVNITPRHLVSDLGGIRPLRPVQSKDYIPKDENSNAFVQLKSALIDPREFQSVIDGLAVFKEDPLAVKPGTWLPCNYGWDLLGAVVERASRRHFREYLQLTIDSLNMRNTYFADDHKLIPRRGRQYVHFHNQLMHAGYINRSSMLPSNGLASTVLDLNQFGNTMLSSYRDQQDENSKPGILSSATLRKMWPPKVKYPMGWFTISHPSERGFLMIQDSAGFDHMSLIHVFVPTEDNSCPCDKSTDKAKTLNENDGIQISIVKAETMNEKDSSPNAIDNVESPNKEDSSNNSVDNVESPNKEDSSNNSVDNVETSNEEQIQRKAVVISFLSNCARPFSVPFLLNMSDAFSRAKN